MNDCKDWNPEPDNEYPLCLGPCDGDFNKNNCKDCCVYLDYEFYHDPWGGKY